MTNVNLFRLPCPTYMITHLCLCTENYIVVPLNEDGNIAFWNTTNISELPVILRGHNQLVTAIALSHHPKAYYLCSCSSDHIILWNLLQNNGNPTEGRILHSNMEQPVYCNFCPNNLEIGVSFSYGIWIYSLKENAWIASIEGVCFTIFKFCTNSLIGITDNFVKVWKINTNELENKITIAPGAPSVLPSVIHSNILTIGTTCGHINIYENYCKLIRSILVWKIVVKHQKSKDSNEGTYDDIRSNSFPVLAIHVFKFENQYELPNMLPETIYILVITNTCLFIININNETVLFYLDFNNINSSLNNVETSEIGLVRSAALAQDFNNTTIYISLIPVIDESIIFFKLYLENILNLENKSYQNEENSIFHTPLFKTENDADKSLLIYRMQNSCKIKNLKKSPKPLNHPVTFHSKIKSSGYGTLQKQVTLFHPQLSKSRKCQSLNSLTSKNKSHVDHKDKIVVSENSTISQLQTTADGMYASYASSDGHTDIFRILKKNIKICHTLNCHLGDVNAAKWSHTGKMLITCGNDKTAKIWNFEKSKQNPILTIGVNDNSKALKQKKFHFEESVNQAQFFYLDHFLLISSGNKLYLFDYIINIEKSGIKSCINRSSVKLVKEIPLESKRISAITAANQFFSSIVLCAGTSKSINVVDMTVGKVAWQTDDCGAKSPHIIAINEGSPYTTQSLEMYNLFMTSSLIDGIKIWDLRTKKSVLCYNEHKCRLFPCSATFSPCGKFIISGSEDKSAYNYELRKLSYVDKITDQNADVFIGTAFTPNSQLLLSSMNGSVYFYGKDK